MKTILTIAVLFIASSASLAQPPQPGSVPPTSALQPAEALPADDRPTIDVYALIEKLGDEMDREFVVDPRLPRRLLVVNTTVENGDYDSLLALLRNSNWTAYTTADQTIIIPDAQMRSMPSRILQEDDRRVSDHEVVTRILEVSGIPPAQLVPILRPMLGQPAQLGAVNGTNRLVMVDYYDNVRRITAVIEEIVEGITAE